MSVKILGAGLLLLLVLWRPEAARAQLITDEERENFAFTVHTIDDFIDRFNARPNQQVREAMDKRNIDWQAAGREDWVHSLINPYQDWPPKLVPAFISDVTNVEAPANLSFDKEGWYATLNCTFVYQTQSLDLNLTMKVEQDKDHPGFKWVITGFQPHPALPRHRVDPLPTNSDRVFLNPMSHGTDFAGLSRALQDKKHLVNYFDYAPGDLAMNNLAWEIYEGRLVFQRINAIQYHFLQVPGWIFRVNYFERNERSAGWLISQLTRTNKESKDRYRRRILFTQ